MWLEGHCCALKDTVNPVCFAVEGLRFFLLSLCFSGRFISVGVFQGIVKATPHPYRFLVCINMKLSLKRKRLLSYFIWF